MVESFYYDYIVIGAGSAGSYIRETAGTTQHYCGTCRMGTDKDSVVDTELKVRGISGLRVINSSVFPLSITANTAAATMMIADKGTDIIIRSLSSS